MAITWEKTSGIGNYYGYTKNDVDNDDLHTYKIEDYCHLIWSQNNHTVRVRCYSIVEAQKMAEIIEGGKDVE